ALIPTADQRHYSSARGGHAGGTTGSGDTPGQRLLKLIYPKRSVVVVLRRWAEEGRTVQNYQLNHVVRELRKYSRLKHTMELSLSKIIGLDCYTGSNIWQIKNMEDYMDWKNSYQYMRQTPLRIT
uniref:Uncharacterized protein n=1 Tax=Zea mays TaxID=4577 RepID=A0A804PCC4_MAIZE